MSAPTRRHWLREVRDAVRYPLTMLEGKHGKGGKLSQFRVVLFAFCCAFVVHWPGEWSGPAVAALAVLVFGLPVSDLFARVPVSEALGALQAFFGNVMGKAAAAVSERAGGYFSQATAWSGSAPTSGEVLGEADLMPPVSHGRADP